MHAPGVMPESPFIFVSYSHDDSSFVLSECQFLSQTGFEVWYDDSLNEGRVWADELAVAVEKCTVFVIFITPNAVRSQYCFDELSLSIELNKPVLAIHLEETELSGGFRLCLGTRQALFAHTYTQETYRTKLVSTLQKLLEDAPSAPRQPAQPVQIKQSTTIWQVPLKRNQKFSGREQLLDDIDAELLNKDELNSVALVGLGGVGKTQLALEYAYRNQGNYDLVAWIRSEEEELLQADMVNLAEIVVPDLLLDGANATAKYKLEVLFDWLSNNSSWLLIFDNATGPEPVSPYIPSLARGNILYTSRFQMWSSSAHKIDIDVMSEAEATIFIERRLRLRGEEAVSELAKLLGYLPLAIEEAVAYIEATGRSLGSYIDLFTKHQHKLLERSTQPESYPHRLVSTWKLSLESAAQENAAAARVLQICSLLAADDIPFNELLKGVQLAAGPLSNDISDELDWDDCIATLAKYSLIKLESDAFAVHRLVQMVTREYAEDLGSVLEEAIAIVRHAFPSSGTTGNAKPETARLYPHALALLERIKDTPEVHSDAPPLMEAVGSYISSQGNHQLGKEYLVRAHNAYLAQDADPITLVRELINSASISYGMGDLEEALNCYDMARDVQQAMDKQQHGLIGRDGRNLIGLAWVLRSAGMFEQADKALNMALSGIERAAKVEKEDVVMLHCIRARVSIDLGNVDNARESLKESLDFFSENPKVFHAYVGGAYHHLGQTFFELGDVNNAKACNLQSLQISEMAYGKDHIFVALAKGLLGAINRQNGDYERAVSNLESAISSARRTSSFIHDDAGIWRPELAATLLDMENLESAAEQLHICEQEFEKLSVFSALSQGLTWIQSARLHRFRGQLEVASELCDKAITALSHGYGNEHHRLAPAYLELGTVEYEQGEFDRSAASLGRAIGCCAATENPTVLAPAYQLLGQVSEKQSNHDKARTSFEKALEQLNYNHKSNYQAIKATEEKLKQMEV